jgi:hypothetical protein
LLEGPPVKCAHCQRARATTLDHDPPLAMHVHKMGSTCCRLVPSCERCNREGGVLVANGKWRPGDLPVGAADPDDTVSEPVGLSERDPRFRKGWLQGLLPVPAEAVWPRLMTVPHPGAVGSLGDEFCAFAESRAGGELRWWQRLVAARLLEVDAQGRLCWEAAVISTARQVGKSWWLRELCMWRIHQAERFGEPQDVLHTGKDLAVCKEIQRPARVWAKARRDEFKVREVNGQEEIEHLETGSRWMLRAKEAVYGYSVSLGAVDEAWHVKTSAVDEGLTPTMTEREQPQLVLVSTAHRRATGLVLDRRTAALADLETGNGDLLIEWSAPRDRDPDDREAWRLASPHWTARRQRLISGAHQRMQAGETVPDADEPDPEESFRAQWLNQWPIRKQEPSGPTEPLLPEGVWAGLLEPGPPAVGPVWVGLEDDYGIGAAVGCARRCDDGRVELDGWTRADWDSAVADLVALAAGVTIRRVLVGASMFDRLPPELRKIAEPRAGAATRTGLALLRDLALNGGVVHDAVTGELDDAVGLAHVRENANGLFLVDRGSPHLVKAMVWALAGAHRPAAVPAIR